MNSSCITPDDYVVYMKRLENNGRVYPYYYSIWFDIDKDDFDFCIYGKEKYPLKLDTNAKTQYRLYIDGKYVKVNKSLCYRPKTYARKEYNICREVSEQMYQREALWYLNWSSTNRSTYMDLTDTLCHPSLK